MLNIAQECGFAEAELMTFQKKVDWKNINALRINDIDGKYFRFEKKQSKWLLRIRSQNRIGIMKILAYNFSNCNIIAGEFGEHGDEVSAFVKAENEEILNKCLESMKKNLEVNEVKKIIILEEGGN